MLLLASTSDKIQVVTGAAADVRVHASWLDNASGTITPGRTNTASISSATTTDVVAAPASSTQRTVQYLSARNNHASTSCAVTIQHTDGSNVEPLWSGTLLAGEQVVLSDGAGWQYLDANGNPKLAASKLDTYLQATADVANSTTSFADITGLTVSVKSGKKYMFEAWLIFQTAVSTTGAQFGVNGPSMSYVIAGARQTVTSSATAAAESDGVATALDTNMVTQTTGPGTVNSTAHVGGQFTPSADGTFAMRLRSEVAASAVTVKQGSWLHVRELDN